MENVAIANNSVNASANAGGAAKFANGNAVDKDLFAAFVVNVSNAQGNDDAKRVPARDAAPAPRADNHDNKKSQHTANADVKPTAPAKPKAKNDDHVKAADKDNAHDRTDAVDGDDQQTPHTDDAPAADAPRVAKDNEVVVNDDAAADTLIDEEQPIIAVIAKTPVIDDKDTDQPVIEVAENADETVDAAVLAVPVATVAAVARMAAKVKNKDDGDDSDALLLQAAQKKIALGSAASADDDAAKAAPAKIMPVLVAPVVDNKAAADADADKTAPVAGDDTHPLATTPKHAGAKGIDAATLQALAGNSQSSSNAPAVAITVPVSAAAASATKPAVQATNGVMTHGDALARPLGAMAGQAEAGKAAHARLARLPATMLTQVQEQVAVKLRYAAKVGEKSMSMQLRPEELGRVDIKLDFKDNNMVSARVTADTPMALDLLQKSRNGLEQALNDAGLKLESNGLTFDLRQGSGQQGQAFGDGSPANDVWSSRWQDSAPREIDVQLVSSVTGRGISADGRVDIHV